MGPWWVRLSKSRLSETGHRHDLDIALLEVDDRDQVVDEWHLERRSLTVNNQAVLGETGDNSDHHPEPIPVDSACFQTDQILRPELTLLESSPPLDHDLGASDLFGRLPVFDPFESDLESLVNATNRPHLMGAVLDPNGGSGVEVDDVFGLDVEAEEPPETVGPPEPSYSVPSAFSRRTRRQL